MVIGVTGAKKQPLTEAAEALVALHYHEDSNTHIAYCMAIGRHGIKGFGHTADVAYEEFGVSLRQALRKASKDDLAYWSLRCAAATSKAERGREERAITTEQPLSGQIWMAVPEAIGAWIAEEVVKHGTKRNPFVLDLVQTEVAALEERIDCESSDLIRSDIKARGTSGDTEWSQRVPPELQAKLILLARRFDVSAAMIARFCCANAYSKGVGGRVSPRDQSMKPSEPAEPAAEAAKTITA